MLETPRIRQYAIRRDNLFGAVNQQATRPEGRQEPQRLYVRHGYVKIQSALHGDMQRSAEMTDPYQSK